MPSPGRIAICCSIAQRCTLRSGGTCQLLSAAGSTILTAVLLPRPRMAPSSQVCGPVPSSGSRSAPLQCRPDCSAPIYSSPWAPSGHHVGTISAMHQNSPQCYQISTFPFTKSYTETLRYRHYFCVCRCSHGRPAWRLGGLCCHDREWRHRHRCEGPILASASRSAPVLGRHHYMQS